MLAPFVLRRLKASVLKQLVGKTEMVERVPLSEVITSLCIVVVVEYKLYTFSGVTGILLFAFFMLSARTHA